MLIVASIIGGAGDGIRIVFRYAFRFYKLVERIVGICLLGAVAGTVHTVVFIALHVADVVETILDILILFSVCVLSIYM